MGEDVAPGEFVAFGAGEVGGHPRDRAGLRLVVLVGLEATHADPPPRRIRLDGLGRAQTAARERPGRDRARALDREDAVDEQPRARGLRKGRRREEGVERRDERVEPRAGLGRDGDHGSVGERGSRDPVEHLFGRERERLLVDQIAFRERHDAAGHTEDVEDLQVFLGLRFPPLVRRDDEQDETHRTDPREHVPDEPLVPGHVHEPDLATAGEGAPRVPEVDREAAAFLLRPPVRVHPSQPHDQGRLPMVDVAGRRDDAQLPGHVNPRRRGRRPPTRKGPRGRDRAAARP